MNNTYMYPSAPSSTRFAHGGDDLATAESPRAPEAWLLEEMAEESRQREIALEKLHLERAAAAAALESSRTASSPPTDGDASRRKSLAVEAARRWGARSAGRYEYRCI